MRSIIGTAVRMTNDHWVGGRAADVLLLVSISLTNYWQCPCWVATWKADIIGSATGATIVTAAEVGRLWWTAVSATVRIGIARFRGNRCCSTVVRSCRPEGVVWVSTGGNVSVQWVMSLDEEEKEKDVLMKKKTWPPLKKQHNGDLNDRKRVRHVRKTCFSCSFHSTLCDILFAGNAVLHIVEIVDGSWRQCKVKQSGWKDKKT